MKPLKPYSGSYPPEPEWRRIVRLTPKAVIQTLVKEDLHDNAWQAFPDHGVWFDDIMFQGVNEQNNWPNKAYLVLPSDDRLAIYLHDHEFWLLVKAKS